MAVVGGTIFLHNILFRRVRGAMLTRSPSTALRSAQAWTVTAFVVLVGLGAMAIGGSLNAVVQIIMTGASTSAIEGLAVSILGLAGVVVGTTFLIYRLDLGTGFIRKRVRVLEIGWENDETL